MDKLNVKYDFSTSAISDIRDINSSFAKGRLKVMYLGANRNKTFFSRDAVQRALPSLKNVPVVCNWSYEDGIIGGHDMDCITDANGNMRMMNLTDPCGVVPDHAKFSFVTEFDDNGISHEYLVVDDVILWKRQDVFSHIKNDLDGKVDHSMEVTILDKAVNAEGQVDIKDFEFTALCLLERDKPCFQGSELELYSENNNAERFRAKFEQMLEEMKNITPVNTSNEDNNNKFSVEGGDKNLEEKIQLITNYGFTAEELDFAIEDITMEELEEKLKAFSSDKAESDPEPEAPAEPEAVPAEPESVPAEPKAESEAEPEAPAEPEADPAPDAAFALEAGFSDELRRTLESEKVTYDWGSVPRYYFVDYDKDNGEVYAYDENDWLLYGFAYSVNGDAITIDFANKQRKKFSIVNFEGAEQANPFAEVYSQMNEKIVSSSEMNDKFAALGSEVEELRKFKAEVDAANVAEARERLFAQFTSLQGNAAFETLVSECEKYDLETLEEKCYAILGRAGSMKFSLEQKAPKTMIERNAISDDDESPYGGIVEKFN